VDADVEPRVRDGGCEPEDHRGEPRDGEGEDDGRGEAHRGVPGRKRRRPRRTPENVEAGDLVFGAGAIDQVLDQGRR
jgi:hypothetical protein